MMKPFLQAYNGQQIIVPYDFLHLKRNYSMLERAAPKPASQFWCSRDAQPCVSPIIEKLIVSNSNLPFVGRALLPVGIKSSSCVMINMR